jgi:hypothetical protein
MRTTQEIDHKLGELGAKRRDCVAQADALDLKAAEEVESGNSESAEDAFKLRAQIPAIDRAMATLQNERIEAVERERRVRDQKVWDEMIRPGAKKLLSRIENVVGFLDIIAVELNSIRREGFDLVNRAPKLRGDFDRSMLSGTLSNLCHLRLRDREMIPPPIELRSPETMVREFCAMLLYLAPPEESNNTETSSEPAQPAAK